MRRRRDINMEIAGQLYNLALVHPSPHVRLAYKRAAGSVLALDRPLTDMIRDGTLPAIRYVGPSSQRIIREFLAHGTSPSVEQAIGRRTRGGSRFCTRVPNPFPQSRCGCPSTAHTDGGSREARGLSR
jgi:hypothetical protein